MHAPIQYTIEWTLKPGGADAFKQLAQSAIDAVRENEPGMKGYQWYFNEDGTKSYLSEWFDNSGALLEHLGNVGPILPQFFDVSEITAFQVLGDLSPEARKAVAELNAEVHGFWSGFVRH
jgi:quinol monooxygenase YgiN